MGHQRARFAPAPERSAGTQSQTSRILSRLVPLVLTLGLAPGLACSGDPEIEEGAVGWPCPNRFHCFSHLVCANGVCSEPGQDAGPPVDAGPRPDTGPMPDAGPIDAGPEPDAGPIDGGPPDAGCNIPGTLSVLSTQVFGADGQPSCNQRVCHGEEAAGGIRLTPPLSDVHAALLGPTRDPDAPERDLVVPGDPEASRLYVIMRDREPVGQGGAMPPASPVGICELEAVRLWIADGALDN